MSVSVDEGDPRAGSLTAESRARYGEV